VTFPGLQGRMSFRDVFEVDGRSVRDASHQDRLLKLFMDRPQDAVRRAREIEEAGAWFNLADIGTLSDPLITAGFLQTGFRRRFHFERAGLEKSLGPDVRIVRFEERQRPTVIKSGPDHDLPARGVVWVEEGTGRIVKTQLKLGLTDIVTSYRWDEELQMMVPGEMRESYPAPPARLGAISAKKDDVRCLATYSRFRRFDVRTTETIR